MSTNQLSYRINQLAESETLKMSQKSTELKEQGIDVINLTVGEPDFNTPTHVKQAAIQAINDNITKYAPVPGYPKLRQAICDKLQRDNQLTYKPSQIIVSNGAKHSLANVLQCVVDKGDEVIILAPYWVSYIELVKLSEGTPVIVEAGLEQDFKITPAQLEKAITPKTKVVMFNSPSNPTGSIYSYQEVEAMVEVLRKYPNIIVLSDEIYETINYVGKHTSFAQFDGMIERTVVINGVSKGYAMTGWRIGYIAAPLWIAQATSKLQGQYTSGACSIAQMASLAAIDGDQSCVTEMRDAFLKRRDVIIGLMKEIPGFKLNVPDGAFYVFPDVSYYFGKSDGDVTIKDSTDFSMFLLEKGHVASVPGSAFGSPDCVRFSYAAGEATLKEAIERIKKSCATLK